MIYTVTLNPSIDFLVEVENLRLNQLNRIKNEKKFPGGKGINVSRVLHRLGTDTTVLGFAGGFTGRFIEDWLKKEGISTQFVYVGEDTRINIKLKNEKGEETEINGQGPFISPDQYRQFEEKLLQVKPGDTVVLAGSIPRSLSPSLYEELTSRLSDRGIRVVVDIEGPVLAKVASRRPFLVKPNHHELGQLFNARLETAEEVIPYGRRLQQMGAEHVIVSMAGKGALLFTPKAVYMADVPKGNVVHSVGAGDSMVAGFIAAYDQSGDIVSAFQTSVAAGSATAFSQDLCRKEQVEHFRKSIRLYSL
ncbi:1-phosphofructokinase [Thermoactinomyces mirandus]|uniref:Tagatose-6-phosphate kinase n=1 Tax=Thermoactinomyces mirandus TaxID=2756294 RepID=A0A7W2AR33_9BACL|nr:1-phosphofructokinase [Thermoactinomyces mirandus]MBA4602153.1 1-phosphofructokinase [Thermoactinomyces mirandus]